MSPLPFFLDCGKLFMEGIRIEKGKGNKMKLAIISDVHANYKALEAFLQYIEKDTVDGIICLGDYITDGPYPQKTLGMLRDMMKKYPCYMVRGNREEYLIHNYYNPQGWKPSSPNGALDYTAEHITEEDIRFFESLESTDKLCLEDYPELTICHGTPGESRGNFMETPSLKETCMEKLDTDYLIGGHSHHQEMFELFGKTYINPGALGLAIDGIGRRAQFAMLLGIEKGGKKAWEAQLISIPYDVDAYLEAFTQCGLDERGMVLTRAVKKTLLTGVNYFYFCVVEAWKLTGKVVSETPEEIWNQVAEKLEV